MLCSPFVARQPGEDPTPTPAPAKTPAKAKSHPKGNLSRRAVSTTHLAPKTVAKKKGAPVLGGEPPSSAVSMSDLTKGLEDGELIYELPSRAFVLASAENLPPTAFSVHLKVTKPLKA